eukprot:jgi/Botrbrau1/17700/Bobra.0166s0124.1
MAMLFSGQLSPCPVSCNKGIGTGLRTSPNFLRRHSYVRLRHYDSRPRDSYLRLRHFYVRPSNVDFGGVAYRSFQRKLQRCCVVPCRAEDRHQHRGEALPETNAVDDSNEARKQATFAATLFASGAVFGTLLDGIHGTVHLLNYDVVPLEAAGLHSSWVVPPLLGTFYAIIGPLQIYLDHFAAALISRKQAGPIPEGLLDYKKPISVTDYAFCTAVLAALLALSAVMFAEGLPSSTIFTTLAVLGLVNWLGFDRTIQGFALAVLCAVGAPLSELFIIKVLGFWHYTRPDRIGLPVWVSCCYFFYTPSVSTWARFLWGSLHEKETC